MILRPFAPYIAGAAIVALLGALAWAYHKGGQDQSTGDRIKRAEQSLEDTKDAQERREEIRALDHCQLERDALERLSRIDAGDAFERCRAEAAGGEARDGNLSGPQ